MTRAWCYPFILAGLALALPAAAHELQTVALHLDEGAGGVVVATLKTPLTRDGRATAVVPRFDPACTVLGESRVQREPRRIVREWRLHCANGLAGKQFRFEGLDPRTPEGLISARFSSGATQIIALDRHDPAVVLEQRTHPEATPRLTAYLPIGIEHILLGPDHLLFVLGLMLVVRKSGKGLRMLVAALTAFTVAHSLTLALAMLGIWGLPPKPVELLIALSIALLAVELASHEPRLACGLRASLTLRKPWLVAFVFGLLHGFGFAGALSEIGLPNQARGWALFLFNLGVEIGQLIFVGAILLALAALRRLSGRESSASWNAVAVTLLGGIAVYWTLDRSVLWSATLWQGI
ncbi:MAG: HupE/UreJ family protein [Nevskiales bacterium]